VDAWPRCLRFEADLAIEIINAPSPVILPSFAIRVYKMNLKHFFNPLRVMLPVFLTLALAFAASTGAIRKIQTAPAEEKLARARPKPQASPSGSEANSGAERELGKVIDQAIDESEIAEARWGIAVVSLRDGHTIYGRNSDKLFTPASNMKIYTTAVALDLLGADHEWRTSVYANAEPDAAGVIAGDLVLYGRGAPDLVAQTRNNNDNSLARLADDLYNRGVRRVRGNVIGDESYFRGHSGMAGNGTISNGISAQKRALFRSTEMRSVSTYSPQTKPGHRRWLG
jgi:D-alanyl-D-alanine carboxypeptidase